MRADILKQIVKIANELDRKGYHKEADELDKIAIQIEPLSDKEINDLTFDGDEDKELRELIGPSSAEMQHEAEMADEQNRILNELDDKCDDLFDLHREKLEAHPEIVKELNSFIDGIIEKLNLPHEHEEEPSEDSDVPFADDGLDKTAAKKKKKPVAKNKKLWARAIAAAKKKFDVYPSRYANHWASNWYEEKGGEWE